MHLQYTLPWNDDGFRILPAAMFMKYTAAMRAAEVEYRATVDAFVAEYPRYVAEAQVRLGALFNPDFYPTQEQVAQKYPWSCRFTPLPSAGDFRVDLGADTTAEIKRQIEEQANAAMADAMGDLWTRLHDQVSKITERLNDPDGIFRDSLIKNVVELCELLPALNVTGDKELEQARQDIMAQIAKKEPEVLRKNKAARADTAKAAQDILAKMDAYRPKPKA